MGRESDTHRDSTHKAAPGRAKKRKLVSILFCMALQRSQNNLTTPRTLHRVVAALRAIVTRLEMRSKTKGIFLFVIVTELSNYSEMKCRRFITRTIVSTVRKMRALTANLFRRENFSTTTIHYSIIISHAFHITASSLVTSDTFDSSNLLNKNVRTH